MLGTLTITYNDGTTAEVETKSVDGITFERTYDRSFIDSVGKGMRLEHLWFFGFAALKRATGEERSFDEWADTVEMVAVKAEDDAVPPPGADDITPSS